MSAPLVVNTKDGAVWTRREGTRGGEALYAPEKCGVCPQFVMVTLTELAELGIVGSADVLPMPVGPKQSVPLSGPICSQSEARAAGLDIAPTVEELDGMAETIVHVGDPLSAEVSLAQAVPLLGAAVTALRARVAELKKANAGLDGLRIRSIDKNDHLRTRIAELEGQLAAKDRPADEDPIAFALTEKAADVVSEANVTRSVRKLRSLLAGQRAEAGERP